MSWEAYDILMNDLFVGLTLKKGRVLSLGVKNLLYNWQDYNFALLRILVHFKMIINFLILGWRVSNRYGKKDQTNVFSSWHCLFTTPPSVTQNWALYSWQFLQRSVPKKINTLFNVGVGTEIGKNVQRSSLGKEVCLNKYDHPLSIQYVKSS